MPECCVRQSLWLVRQLRRPPRRQALQERGHEVEHEADDDAAQYVCPGQGGAPRLGEGGDGGADAVGGPAEKTFATLIGLDTLRRGGSAMAAAAVNALAQDKE